MAQSLDEIHDQIIKNAEIKGTNLWLLMIAIVIASLGLNVNSTAVIIGAMLISPLMGPIFALSYAIRCNEFDLLKTSARGLGIAIVISIIVSTLYFIVTPLALTQSELIARISPTIWDVLIGLFGGIAGMIGITRRSAGNILPGVAIATALMPPLCTVSFGIASWQWEFVTGAFYLFFINCVFIFIGGIIALRAMHVSALLSIENARQKRVFQMISFMIMLGLVPSIILTYSMVRKSLFEVQAKIFINDLSKKTSITTLDTRIDYSEKKRILSVLYLGETLSPHEQQLWQDSLPEYDLRRTELRLNNTFDIDRIIESQKQSSKVLVDERDFKIKTLEKQLQTYQLDPITIRSFIQGVSSFTLPIISHTILKTPPTSTDSDRAGIIIVLKTSTALSGRQKKQVQDFATAHFQTDLVKLFYE